MVPSIPFTQNLKNCKPDTELINQKDPMDFEDLPEPPNFENLGSSESTESDVSVMTGNVCR